MSLIDIQCMGSIFYAQSVLSDRLDSYKVHDKYYVHEKPKFVFGLTLIVRFRCGLFRIRNARSLNRPKRNVNGNTMRLINSFALFFTHWFTLKLVRIISDVHFIMNLRCVFSPTNYTRNEFLDVMVFLNKTNRDTVLLLLLRWTVKKTNAVKNQLIKIA